MIGYGDLNMIFILPIYLVCILIFLLGDALFAGIAAISTTLFIVLAAINHMIYPPNATHAQMFGSIEHDSFLKLLVKGLYGFVGFTICTLMVIFLIAGVISIFR